MSSEYLFVYGLLRRKALNKMSDFLNENARFVSEATFQGKLYLIEHYPGVTESKAPADRVAGDLFRLKDPSILGELDRFEGIGDGAQEPWEYLREIRQVLLSNGTSGKAWIYLYNWEVNGKKRIPSGDFLTYLELAR